MNKDDQDFKKTQSTSSPGALGEDVNRNKRKSEDPITHRDNETAKQEGLNEQNSPGAAGAYEGLEDMGK